MWRQFVWAGWPAFIAACLLEALVFAFVDPADIHRDAGLRDLAIYSIAFLVFWAVSFVCGALSIWLHCIRFAKRCGMLDPRQGMIGVPRAK